MKKTILCSALLILMGAQGQAADAPETTATPSVAAPTSQPTSDTPAPQQPTQAVPVINCDYKISADTKKIEAFLVMTWAQKAVVQSFEFNPESIDAQLVKLKSCFTTPGWEGFNTALQKSGNIEAIKSQKLQVSSQVDGQPQVTEAKDNQWEVSLPLQVVYQNDKEKVTQKLQVTLSIGRKVSGDLGINKMIATTRNEAGPKPAEKTPSKDVPNQATPATSTTPSDTKK